MESKAAAWGLPTLYTRLTPAEALARVREADSVRAALRDATVLDGAAQLLEDTARTVQWRFAFYVTRRDGRTYVLAVDGLGQNGAQEGNYSGGYGFGNAARALGNPAPYAGLAAPTPGTAGVEQSDQPSLLRQSAPRPATTLSWKKRASASPVPQAWIPRTCTVPMTPCPPFAMRHRLA